MDAPEHPLLKANPGVKKGAMVRVYLYEYRNQPLTQQGEGQGWERDLPALLPDGPRPRASQAGKNRKFECKFKFLFRQVCTGPGDPESRGV